MKKKFMKAMSLLLALICIIGVPVQASAASQGTEGTELEVVQPQQLVIQLGESWSGVEFELRTDAGQYPDTIPVGEDGILKLEIGGSETYTLTCLNSHVEIPVPEDVAAEESTASEETGEGTESTDAATESATEPSDAAETTENAQATEPTADEGPAMVGDVPVTHIIIFVGGLVLAIALLLFMQRNQKNQQSADADEDDEI